MKTINNIFKDLRYRKNNIHCSYNISKKVFHFVQVGTLYRLAIYENLLYSFIHLEDSDIDCLLPLRCHHKLSLYLQILLQ